MNTEGIKNEEMKNTPEIGKTTAEAITEVSTPAEGTAEDLLAKEKDKYLQLFAEFENYKKRTAEECVELFKTAGQDILPAMLPVVGNFDRTLAELPRSSGEDTLTEIELIYNELMTILRQRGLEKVEVAPNDVFDGEHHDVVTQIPAPTPDAKGKITSVVRTGYGLGSKVTRFPKVVVAQ